jgi:hypothetical protein
MNVNVKGHKILGILLLGLCLFASAPSDAHWGGGHGGGHWGGWRGGGSGWGPGIGWGPGWGYGGFYRGGGIYIGPSPVYYNCGWAGGYWRNGYWVPRHRACW